MECLKKQETSGINSAWLISSLWEVLKCSILIAAQFMQDLWHMCLTRSKNCRSNLCHNSTIFFVSLTSTIKLIFVTLIGNSVFICQRYGCMPRMRRNHVMIHLCDSDTRAKTKTARGEATKTLSFLCSSVLPTATLRRRRRSFSSASGSTMDFSERELSPELSVWLKA